MVGMSPRSLGRTFGHVRSVLRFAVIAIALAVIDLAGGVDPDLASGPRWSRHWGRCRRCAGKRNVGCRQLRRWRRYRCLSLSCPSKQECGGQSGENVAHVFALIIAP